MLLLLVSWGNDYIHHIQLAREYYIEGNFDMALREYEKISDKKIDNLIAIERAQSAYKSGNYTLAAQLYKLALEQQFSHELNSTIYYNLALCFTNLNDRTSAIDYYKLSIKTLPTKAAKHNLLLLKEQMKLDQAEAKKSPLNELQTNADLNQSNALGSPLSRHMEEQLLYDRKIEKILDDLAKKDASTKQKVSKKINMKKEKTNKKDW